MMKKLLMILLVLCFFLPGCSEKEPDLLTASQEEMFAYFPSGTQFILYMNLSELRKTEFWSDYFEPSITSDTVNNWLSDFEAKTGMGLTQGISEIVSATTWDGNDVFCVRFEGNTDRVRNYFDTEEKFSSAELGEQKVYLMNDSSNARFYFAKNDLLLIMKHEDYLADVIKGTHKKIDKNSGLYSIVKKIKNKDHYWIATNKGGFAAGLLNLLAGNKDLPVKKITASVTGISLSARFSEGVDITSVWECSNSKDAYLLSSGVRSALAMDLLAGKDYALNQLFKKLEIERDGKDIHFEINIDKEELNGIKELAGKRKLSQTL